MVKRQFIKRCFKVFKKPISIDLDTYLMKEYAILLFRRYIIDMIGMSTVREICLIKRVSLL